MGAPGLGLVLWEPPSQGALLTLKTELIGEAGLCGGLCGGQGGGLQVVRAAPPPGQRAATPCARWDQPNLGDVKTDGHGGETAQEEQGGREQEPGR